MKELESTFVVGVSTEGGELGSTNVESLAILINNEDKEKEEEVDSVVLTSVAADEEVVVVVLVKLTS